MQGVPIDYSPIVAVLLLQPNPKCLLPVIWGLPYVCGIACPLGSELVLSLKTLGHRKCPHQFFDGLGFLPMAW